MSAPKKPDVWIELILVPYPTGSTVTYRWSTRPLAWPTWIEGRVLKGGWGTVERAFSDFSGSYEIQSMSVGLEDGDGLIRGLIDGLTTQYFTSQEVAVKLLSEAGRRAGLTPRVVMRGQATTPTLTSGRHATLEVTDRLGSGFALMNLDRPVAQVQISRAMFPNCPREVIGKVIPIIYGEHSDAGAVDNQGNPAERGMIPPIFVGMRRTVDDDPLSGVAAYLSPPVVTAAVNGTPGTRTLYYGVTAHSDFGQTELSDVAIVTTGPAVLDATNYISLSWPAITGAVAYTVYGRSWSTPVKKLATVTTNAYSDQGQDSEQFPAPPLENTAQIEDVDGSFFWDFYLVALGYVEIHAWYASNVGAAETPTRELMPTSTAGVDFLIPGYAGWPHANNYLDIDDGTGTTIRITGFYARGPRSWHHKTGVVTMALAVCGTEDVGDGTGTMIDAAFPVLQHLLNEHVFKDDGVGYRSGTWGPLETFADGTAMIDTDSFADAQTVTEGFIGGDGYKAAFCIAEPMAVRELLQRFCTTFNCFVGTNQHGQIRAGIMNDLADPTAGTLYQERLDLKQIVEVQIKPDLIENKIQFRYDWDTDSQKYRGDLETIEDADSQAAYRSKRTAGELDLWCTRDRTTARDAMARRLLWRKVAPMMASFASDLMGQETDLGDQIRVTHREFPYVERPFYVLRHSLDLNGPGVTLTCFDLNRVLVTGGGSGGGFNALADETAGSTANILGNETSPSDPPTGAFELR